MHVSAGVHRGQKRAVVSCLMWVLGTELGFSARAVCALSL